MKQLELQFDSIPDPVTEWETTLRARPFSSYLSALGLLRLMPDLKGYWKGDRFVIDTEPEAVVSDLLENYRPSPIFTPWNKGGGWLVQSKKANAEHIKNLRNSGGDRFSPMREGIEAIDRVYEIAKSRGFFGAKGDYVKPEYKAEFVAAIRAAAPDRLVQWTDVVYAFAPEDLKAIPLAGKAGSEGTGEYSKTFADAVLSLFELDGEPKANCDRALRSLLCREFVAPVHSKISPGLFDPSAGGLGRRFTDGGKFDPTINPWSAILFLEGALAFASQMSNKFDGFDRGSAAVPFAVKASNVGYPSAAEEGFKLELWVPLWSKSLTFKKLEALFRRGRSRLDDRPVRDGLQFARSLPQFAGRTGIGRLERYGIIERASERGNTWACHLGSFFTDQKDVAIVDQAESWVNRFSKQAESRSLKERYFQTLTGRLRLEDFIIDLGNSFAQANRSPGKFESIPPPRLGKKWAKRLLEDNDTAEVRLAIALSRAWTFRIKSDKEKEAVKKLIDKANELMPWTFGNSIDALIDANRKWVVYASQNNKAKDFPRRGFPWVRLDDLTQFLLGETDDDRLWALARGLRFVSTASIDLGFKSGCDVPPGFEAIAICWHQCELWRGDSKGVKSEKMTFAYEGQILTGLASGRAKTAIDAALRRLRTDLPKGEKTGAFPTLKGGHDLPKPTARRWAAALAFPISDGDIQFLIHSLTQSQKDDDTDTRKTPR